MNVDYYALLTKAVAGKDAAARDRIYKDAYGLIKRSQLTRQTAAPHTAALENAIRRIEDDIAAEEAKSAADINEVLSTGRNWTPFVFGAGAVVAVIAVAALVYGYVATKGPGILGAGVTASSSKASRIREDVVMADLKPGVDGGSTSEGLPFTLHRQVVFYRTTLVPGSIVIDRVNRFLYLIDANNSARRYGIGIAQECLNGGQLVPRHQQARMARLEDFKHEHAGGGRIACCSGPSRQSAWCTRAVAGQTRAAHPWDKLAKNHRSSRRFRMHPVGKRRCRGLVPARLPGNEGRVPQLGDRR
jgi:hypothetical protein